METATVQISITRPGPAARWSLAAVSGDLEISWHGIASRADAEAIAAAFLAIPESEPARPAQLQLELLELV